MRYFTVVCMLLTSMPMATAAEMSHEEAVVRNTYAKLSYAVDLNTAYRAFQANPKISAADLARQVELQGLRFKLSDFTVGNLAHIAEAKYADVFPQYDDNGEDVIHTNVTKENYGEVGGATASMETATAKWGPAPNGRAPDYTVGQMIPVLEREMGVSPPLRYCSFTVTATLAGRSRTYEASFFFGAKDQVAPADAVADVGGGALWHFLLHPLYPDILLRTRIGEIPAVREFLTANQRSNASCKSGEACCDAETLQCGVFSADLTGRQP